MTFLQSLILGIIQGLTEFLPISSSAHLVLVPYLFNWSIPESQVFPFDVLVQIGTLLAVILYFWKDLLAVIKAFVNGLIQRKPFAEADSRLGWYLILATIPAGIAGLFLKSQIEAAFSNPKLTAYFLFGTALLLLAGEFFSRKTRVLHQMKWLDALWIGIFQALSIFPGISRSGSTITGGLTRNFDRPAAARFSFLMSIPVMIAAGVMSISDLLEVPDLGKFLPVIAVGFITAAIVGYLSIHWLLSFIKNHSFVYFAFYCILLASLVVVVSNVRAANPPAVSQPADPAIIETLPAADTPGSPEGLVQVLHTPALDWLDQRMSACASALPGVDLVVKAVSPETAEISADQILLRWGELPGSALTAYQLGSDQLVLAVNAQNGLESLTPALVRDLFSGKLRTWQELQASCDTCFAENYTAPGDAIALYTYAQQDESQQLFARELMLGQPVATSLSTYVPSALTMQSAISLDLNALGLLPARTLNANLSPLTLTDFDLDTLTLPLLAYTAQPPADSARQWLACLQETLNP